jgi:glycosyltransferase involved in cell wall biosynthesis
MKTILVEGWRFIPHSYAMVSQHQCLELLKRSDVRVVHRDIPFPFPHWRPAPGVFSPDDEARLRAIPAPTPDLRPDAVLRMGWPHFFHADAAARATFTWVTSEALTVEDVAMGIRRPAREVLPLIESRIIACSTWAAQGFINAGAPKERISIVPCGVDPAVFKPLPSEERAALRKKFGWEGKLVLLNISAMTGNKGIPYLLKAAAMLVPRFPNLLVVLKGSDTLYASGRNAQSAFGSLTPAEAQTIAPRINYAGQTFTTPQMAQLYQAADLYVSPYLAEGFNLPVLEAAACGLPVICTRGGSTDDFVDDSFASRIDSTRAVSAAMGGGTVLHPNLEHLISLLAAQLGDEDARKKAGRAGAAWAHDRFTWAQSIDKLLAAMFPTGSPPDGR